MGLNILMQVTHLETADIKIQLSQLIKQYGKIIISVNNLVKIW
jgi:hypothetical protein